MNATVVVDVGNSRIKWGRCSARGVETMAALAFADESAWAQQIRAWNLPLGTRWALGGPNPEQRDRLGAWLARQGHAVQLLDSFRQVPLRLAVDRPEQVGLDRLFNAVAANQRRHPDHAALIIGAGTAITVDLLDSTGVFRGGAIMPGLRLMARALHKHTARLPLLDDFGDAPLPGTNTEDALRGGVRGAVLGGIDWLTRRMAETETDYFLTGGDAAWLAARLEPPMRTWPEMTLEGMRLCLHDGVPQTPIRHVDR